MFKPYRRVATAEMAPWTPETDMTRVSVADVEREKGSPKIGDMIARNPKDHNDLWLVSAEYFADNFKPINAYDPADMVRRPAVLHAGPLKIACYQVRDPVTDELSPRQFHMTFDNTVMAVMAEEAAKLFCTFVTRTLKGEPVPQEFTMALRDDQVSFDIDRECGA